MLHDLVSYRIPGYPAIAGWRSVMVALRMDARRENKTTGRVRGATKKHESRFRQECEICCKVLRNRRELFQTTQYSLI
jgi:hypothetical protein